MTADKGKFIENQNGFSPELFKKLLILQSYRGCFGFDSI